MKITVICPSRGRPDNAVALWDSFYATANPGYTKLRIAVDVDDPKREIYRQDCWDVREGPAFGNMMAATNFAAGQAVGEDDPHILGFVGDDHRFRVKDWDTLVRSNLATPGIVYGPDGSNNLDNELPTFWFVSSEIVKALGWFALPDCKHYYLDDAWREIGKELGILRYVPELFIEHMHYSFGKAKMDETYEHSLRVGSNDNHDYKRWREGHGFIDSVQKVREAI